MTKHYIKFPVYILLLITIAYSYSFTQSKSFPISIKSSSHEKVEQINNLIDKYHEFGKFNGAILVSKKGEILINKGLGWLE